VLILFLNIVLATCLKYWGGEFVQWISIESLGLCETSSCYGVQAVYRISCALAFFYLSLGLMVYCCGPQLKCLVNSWLMQVLYYTALLLGFWFVPDSFYSDGYVQVARVVAGCFLLYQAMLLITIVHDFNDKMLDAEKFTEMMAITVSAFLGAITLIIVMYLWFAEGDSCTLQATTVSMTLLLSITFSVLSITRSIVKERGSLMVSAVLSLYIAYLNFSGLTSDPSACNTTAANPDDLVWLIVGLVWSGISVTYTGWSAASNSQTLTNANSEPLMTTAKSEKSSDQSVSEPIPEIDLGTMRSFLLVMGACAMYMCMLLTNWASTEDPNGMTNLSEASMWVQLISEWTIVLLYFWVLFAPWLFPERFE